MFVSVEKLSKTHGVLILFMKIKLMHCLLQTSHIFDNASTDMYQHSLAYFAIKLVVYVKIIFLKPDHSSRKAGNKSCGLLPSSCQE